LVTLEVGGPPGSPELGAARLGFLHHMLEERVLLAMDPRTYPIAAAPASDPTLTSATIATVTIGVCYTLAALGEEGST
jgi:hypothetical protein